MLAKVVPLVVYLITSAQATSVIGLPRNANFDDLKLVTPGTTLQPIPTPYKDLAYNGFDLAAAQAVSVAVLRPSSLANFAIHPSVGAAANITRYFPNSKTQAFDLTSLNAGCYVATNNGIVASPINCTLTFTGTSSQGGKQVTDDFKFGVGTVSGISLNSLPVAPHKLPNTFRLLDSVTVKVTSSATPNVAGATVQFAVDNVKYAAYQAK